MGFLLDYRELCQLLIDRYQSGFPVTSAPFDQIAQETGIDAETIQMTFIKMQDDGLITRLGPVFNTHRVGYSFLAAVECPEDRIQNVAEVINSFNEVNHNYERENKLNLWFVLTGKDEKHLAGVVQEIEKKTGLKVHAFPMLKAFKIDLSLKNKIDWSFL